MTGLRRTLGLVVALAALTPSTWALSASSTGAPRALDEAQDTFKQGIEMLERGRREEALKHFQRLLGMGLTQEQAYDLWKSAGDQAMTTLLVEGGEFELIARRLVELTRVARAAHRDDAEAILALVTKVTSNEVDPIERRRALRTLSSEHGQYAVPHLLPLLSGSSDDDRRVLAMHALAQMSGDVVVPLLEALASDDAMLRRNIAMVLGNIGDRRAAGHLLALAATDPDASVQAAARESATRMNASGDALRQFLEVGDAYHHQRDSVIRDSDFRDVVWSWKDGRLEGTPIPRMLYNDELARDAYFDALAVDPTSVEALAGLARAYVSEQAKIGVLEKGGQDVGAWKSLAQEGLTAVHAAGVEALDLALRWSVETGDTSSATALARVLGPLASAPSAGLQAALASDDGAVRSEAAVSLGMIALRTGTTPSPRVVELVAEAAGREVVRLGAVLDPDVSRAGSLVSALEQHGVYANHWTSGARGLSMLRRSPGLDIVLVAESLTDVTTAQVIDELKADDRTAQVPIIVIAKSAEEAAATYGDRIAGTVTNAGDVQAVEAALAQELSGDRALAEELGGRAAQVLALLAQSGRADLSGAVDGLAGAIGGRPDPVAIPLMRAIGAAGSQAHAAALVDVLADEQRSDEARAAAGGAIAALLGRVPNAIGNDGIAKVLAVATSPASHTVRDGAARALALVQLDPAARAELLRTLRKTAGSAADSQPTEPQDETPPGETK